MNQDRVLKIIKGLNTFSIDDIAVMTGLDDLAARTVIKEYLLNGTISQLSEYEYRYINNIPKRKAAIRLVEKENYKLTSNQDIYFKEAVNCFMSNHALINCTESTFKTYVSITNVHLLGYFGKMKLKEITINDIKRFIELKESQSLSSRRIRNTVTLLGNMLSKFKEWGFIANSPYNGIINVKAQRESNIRVLNSKEVEFILRKSNISLPVLNSLIRFSLATGIKKQELYALKKEDFDVESKKIYINKTMYQGQILIPKVKTVFRQVDIPKNLIPKLKTIIKDKSNKDYVFYDPSTSFRTQDGKIRETFSDIIGSLNLEHFIFNDLKHTYAYNALKQGMSIDYLNKQLGEYSIQSTMDKYRNFVV